MDTDTWDTPTGTLWRQRHGQLGHSEDRDTDNWDTWTTVTLWQWDTWITRTLTKLRHLNNWGTLSTETLWQLKHSDNWDTLTTETLWQLRHSGNWDTLTTGEFVRLSYRLRIYNHSQSKRIRESRRNNFILCFFFVLLTRYSHTAHLLFYCNWR